MAIWMVPMENESLSRNKNFPMTLVCGAILDKFLVPILFHGYGHSPILLVVRVDSSLKRMDSKVRRATNCFHFGNVSPDDGIGWPPPDPDRMPRTRMKLEGGVTTHDGYEADVVQRDVVFMRHAGDGQKTNSAQRRKRFHERYTDASTRDDMEPPDDLQVDGEEAWRNSEGERLADFGLDEEAEFYDDDEGNVPLSLKGKGKPA